MFLLIVEAPLTAYDEIRMKQCMRNNARLQQLGIRTLSNLFASTFITPENKKNNQGDSGSEYNPEEDDTSEGDLRDDNLIPEADALQELESTPPSSMAKVLLPPSCQALIDLLFPFYNLSRVLICAYLVDLSILSFETGLTVF